MKPTTHKRTRGQAEPHVVDKAAAHEHHSKRQKASAPSSPAPAADVQSAGPGPRDVAALFNTNVAEASTSNTGTLVGSAPSAQICEYLVSRYVHV